MNPSVKQRSIDGTVNRKRSNESFRSQRTQEGRRLPTSERSFFDQSRTNRGATIGARHIRFGPRFIDEDKSVGVNFRLRLLPPTSFFSDIRTIPFLSDQRLFFRV